MHNTFYFCLQVSIMLMITFRLLGSYQSLCNQTWRLILVCSAFIRFNFLSYLQLMTGVGLGVMVLCVTIKGVSFLLQTSMGILENAVVLLAYAHIIYGEPRLLPVDVILCHLAPANLMLPLTRCIPQTMTVFGLRDLLNDAGCKAVIYVYHISRALSVCITCMLSVSGSDHCPRWATLIQVEACASFPCPPHLCWTLAPQHGHMHSSPFLLHEMEQFLPSPSTSVSVVDFRDRLSYVINGVAVSGRDFAFVVLMVASSGYILVLLHHHSRQVRGIRRSQGGGAETRAAKAVVTLVVLYVVFFRIDNVIWIYMLTVAKVSPVVADMRVFFSSCYASLSPYFIISSNKKVKAKIVCAAEQEQTSADNPESSDK